jgi:hypothetical protein
VAMATARDLLGEQPSARLRVWYHNGDDSHDELSRRLVAICQHYSIPQEELPGWFFFTSGHEVPLRVAKGYNDLHLDDPLIAAIRNEVSGKEIDVAILDPLVTLHGVSEGDNSRMDTVIRIFAGIADSEQCSVELAHHTRKLPAGTTPTDYSGDDMRGASAIKDAVRAARMLNHMTSREAEELAIPEHERTSYFRVDRVKGNNAPPSKAVWRRFVGVDLPNGDDVGVVEPWILPGMGAPSEAMAEAERRAEDIYMALLVRFTLQGRPVSDRAGRNFAPLVFSREPEAKKARVSKKVLEDAQVRLFAKNKIRVESEGTANHRIYRLVIA